MANPFDQFDAPAAAGQKPKNPFDRFDALASAPAGPRDDGAGMLTRMWRGLTGGDASVAGGVGMGMADPAYGVAQLGAHAGQPQAEMEAAIGSAGTDLKLPPAMTGATQKIDTAIKGREAQYEERQRQATPGIDDPEVGITQPKLATDWARLVGNVVSPVNAAVAAATPAGGVAVRGAPLATRLANAARMGVMGGAAGGAAQPVAGDNFAGEKALQTGVGAAGGALAGPALTAAGAGARTAGAGIRDMLGGAPKPPVPPQEQVIKQLFSRAVNMPAQGAKTAPGIARVEDQRVAAVNEIVGNKANLRFDLPSGVEVTGQLPQTRGQLADAVHQTKESLFRQFDSMKQRAEGTEISGPSTIGRFNNELQAATEKEVAAQQAVAAAEESIRINAERGGSGLDTAIRTRDTKARALVRAQAEVAEAKSNVARPWVDLKPAIRELEQVASDPVVLRDHPSVAAAARRRAEKYAEDEGASLTEAQRQIRNLNKTLEGWYDKRGGYSDAAQVAVDERVARVLREELDKTITGLEGPGYQDLKLKYGALKAIEPSVAAAARKELNKGPVSAFLYNMLDNPSMGHVLRGIVTLNPHATARGLMYQAARLGKSIRESPDRAIASMFRAAESPQQPRTRVPFRVGPGSLTTGAGGAAADEQRNVRRFSMPPPEDRWKGTGGMVQ